MAFCDKKNPPEYTDQIRKWDRETLADGKEMAVEIEQLFNNTVYNKKHLEKVTNSIGQPNGIAELDATGKVPESQLPPQQDIQDASLSQKGIVQLSNDTDSLDDTKAVTPGTLYRIRRNTSLLGTPTAPQANLGDNSSQIANTAFVYNEIRNKIFLKANFFNSVDVNGEVCMNFTQSYELRSTRLVTATHNIYGPVWRNNTGKSIYVMIQLNVSLDTVSPDEYPLRRFAVQIGMSLSSKDIYAALLYKEEWSKLKAGEIVSYICFGIVPTGGWILPSCELLRGDVFYKQGCSFSIVEF